MKKEEKAKLKIENSIKRKLKKKAINEAKKQAYRDSLVDCPFDVEMNGRYGTCDCDGYKRQSCIGDI
jgi:hypothetical protein